MVRKLLADRLFLTKAEKEPKDKKQLITWLYGMHISIRLVVDKSVQSKQPKGIKIREGKSAKYLNKHGDVKPAKQSGHSFRVEIQLVNIRHKKDENDKLNMTVVLINKNGAYTKWHLSDASNWFKRAMPKCGFSAAVEIWDGQNIVSEWTDGRKRKLDSDFFYISASQMQVEARELEARADKMEKHNLLRSAMYRQWAKNLDAASHFYDEVRTS